MHNEGSAVGHNRRVAVSFVGIVSAPQARQMLNQVLPLSRSRGSESHANTGTKRAENFSSTVAEEPSCLDQRLSVSRTRRDNATCERGPPPYRRHTGVCATRVRVFVLRVGEGGARASPRPRTIQGKEPIRSDERLNS